MTKDDITPAPKWRRRAEERPDEVMDAALDLFIEKGFAATRVEDIAKRANLSKGAVYLYFDSKEAVLKGLVRRAIVPVVANAEAMAARIDGDAEQAIRLLITHMTVRLSDQRLSALPRLIIAEAGNFPELAEMYREEVIERGLVLIGHLLKRGMEEGRFRAISPHLAARNVVGPVLAHALLSSVFGIGGPAHIPTEDFVKSHLDILFNGILANPKGGEHGQHTG